MISLITLLALVGNTIAHSWIACSDYRGKNEGSWDPVKCHGYPRDAARYAVKNQFGHDKGNSICSYLKCANILKFD